MSIIEINGKFYQQKEVTQHRRIGGKMGAYLTMAETLSELAFGSRKDPYSDCRNIDIVKEFILIQDKKSNLTKRQRDFVVMRFNKAFQQVEKPKNLIIGADLGEGLSRTIVHKVMMEKGKVILIADTNYK